MTVDIALWRSCNFVSQFFCFFSLSLCVPFCFASKKCSMPVNLRQLLCWRRWEVNRSKWPILWETLLTPSVCLRWEQNIKDCMSAIPEYLCVCLWVCFFRGCSPETRRRLITSPSFAVGWLHLNGSVHLEKQKGRERKFQFNQTQQEVTLQYTKCEKKKNQIAVFLVSVSHVCSALCAKHRN